MIVVLEGIDASGKQTQAIRLCERFRQMGRFNEVDTFDFPHYQGTAGSLVGRILRGETLIASSTFTSQAIDATPDGSGALAMLKRGWERDKALAIQCAMLVDRCEHAAKIASFVSDPSRLLILDRYYLAGLVYGQADGLSRDWLVEIHRILPTPDFFFVIDISVDESFRRRPERADYYEKNRSKLEMVRDLYVAECFRGNAVLVEGERDAVAITDDIVNHVIGRLS